MLKKTLAILALALLFSLPLGYGEETQPWRDAEVLQAALDIGMSAEQTDKFRLAVREFLRGYASDVKRLLNARNRNDLPRKIASKRRARVRTMNDQMAELLSEDQLTAYEDYRELLLEKMDEAAARRRR